MATHERLELSDAERRFSTSALENSVVGSLAANSVHCCCRRIHRHHRREHEAH
jgi:hypothetical protein